MDLARDVFGDDPVEGFLVAGLEVHYSLFPVGGSVFVHIEIRVHGKELGKSRDVGHGIFEEGICHVYLTDLALFVGLEKYVGKSHGVHVCGSLDDIGEVPDNVVAMSVECFVALVAYCVDIKVILRKIRVRCDKLDHVGIVAARKSSVGGNDHYGLLPGVITLKVSVV